MYSINKSDGKVRWTFKGGNWFWADPVVKGKIIYATCLDHKIYAIDVQTGKELWQYEGDSAFISKPVLSGDFLTAISDSGEIYLLDLNNGALKQKISIGYATMAPLYAKDNIIYVHARNDYIYAVDIQTGKVTWKFKPESN